MYLFKLCNPLEIDKDGELKEYQLSDLHEIPKGCHWNKLEVKIPFTYTPMLDKVFNEAIKEIDKDYEITSFAKYCNGKFTEELIPILNIIIKKLGNEFPNVQDMNECTPGNCRLVIKSILKMSKCISDGGVWVVK